MKPFTVYLIDGSTAKVTGRLELPDTGAVVVCGPEGVVLAVAPNTWRMVTTDDAQVIWEPSKPAAKSPTPGGSFA